MRDTDSINSEDIYLKLREEVIDEAKCNGTITQLDQSDIHLATMNRFALLSC